MIDASNPNSDSDQSPGVANETPSGGSLFLISLILCVAALILSSYLAYQSLVKGQAPPGCGSDSGCGAVLSSKWSRWMGIPVSALASANYLMIIIALVLTRKRSTRLAQLGWFISVLAASAVIGSAIWFIYLQLGPLDSICPYCMVDHALGISVAALIFMQVIRNKKPGNQLAIAPVAASVVLGLGAATTLAIVQSNSTSKPLQVITIRLDKDFDQGKGTARRIGLLNGKLQLSPHEEPIIGDPDEPDIIAVMLDYACPHCRHTHELLLDFKASLNDELSIIALPVPMNRKCNPHAPDAERIGKRFDNSCELARIALATHLADKSKYAELDQWLYEPAQARHPDEAMAKAKELVGARALEQALGDPRIEQMIERNVEAYGRDSGADRVPVTMAVGASPLVGRVEDRTALERLLNPDPIVIIVPEGLVPTEPEDINKKTP